MARRRPPNRLARHTAPLHIFAAGSLTIVAFLLQSNLVVRAVQVLVFAALATFAGKRIRWGYFLIMVSSITFFNLLTPVGRVLYELGPLRITAGALEQGLLKGLAIVGLVFISLFSVRPDLRLPGTFGGVLARLFYYFERVLDTRKRVSAARLVESVDEILLELYPPGIAADGSQDMDEKQSARPSQRTSRAGAVLMAALVVGNWAAAMVSWPGTS